MKNVILLNNLFNGQYIKDNVGGEIINIYQSDNKEFYVYVNPYGTINRKWDDRIKYILFIRSVGNGNVKIIGKAIIEHQVCKNVIKRTGESIDKEQMDYINTHNITYGNVKLFELGSWSSHFVTFKASGIYQAKNDIYLGIDKSNNIEIENLYILSDVSRINNQSQKLYVEPTNPNYNTLLGILNNSKFWEQDPVKEVNTTIDFKIVNPSLLSIIRKEDDELVNSNLLAYFLENDDRFWNDFVKEVIKIEEQEINSFRTITRESFANIDILIETNNHVIVIENKIKSKINGHKKNGYSQLEKYYNKVNERYRNSGKSLHFYVLRPNYNNEKFENYNKGKLYEEIKYSEILKVIKERTKTLHIDEFKSLVYKHSKEYNNELFEIMNQRFVKQINSKTQK